MASNVFGSPITDETLEGLPQYAGRTITSTDRAREALSRMDAEEADARAHLESLQNETHLPALTASAATGSVMAFASDVVPGTPLFPSSLRGMVYSATGDAVYFVLSHDWLGHKGAGGYPMEIPNGAWGVLTHSVVVSFGCTGTSGAVVYRSNSLAADFLLAYSTRRISAPFSQINHAYTEIQEQGYYDRVNWAEIEKKLEKSGLSSQATWKGCASSITIDVNSGYFKAVLGIGEE